MNYQELSIFTINNVNGIMSKMGRHTGKFVIVEEERSINKSTSQVSLELRFKQDTNDIRVLLIRKEVSISDDIYLQVQDVKNLRYEPLSKQLYEEFFISAILNNDLDNTNPKNLNIISIRDLIKNGYTSELSPDNENSEYKILYKKIQSFINDLNGIITETELTQKKNIGKFRLWDVQGRTGNNEIIFNIMLDFDGFVNNVPTNNTIFRFQHFFKPELTVFEIEDSKYKLLEEVYNTILLHLTVVKECEVVTDRNIVLKIKPLYKYMAEGLT